MTLVFIGQFYWPVASAQQLNFDLYNKSNGLVNNDVNCIEQGSNGFMLFGTPAGLSVYDGSSFTNYGSSKGFRSSTISSIHELAGGHFALFTNSSQVYRFSDQRLSADSPATLPAVKNLYLGSSGRRYASTYSGLYISEAGRLRKLPVPNGRFPGINCVMEWQDSLLIVGKSYESLEIYDSRTWKLVASSQEKLFVRNIYVDASQNVWLASIGSGVLVLRPASIHSGHIAFENLPPPFEPFLHSEFRAIVGDRKNNIWMASVNEGLIKYNPDSGTFSHITTDQGLASNTVFCLYCDKEDNLWIGTNSGLQKLVHKDVLFYSSRQGLPADLVLDLQPLPGNSFITCGYSGVGYQQGYGQGIRAWRPPLEDEYFLKLTGLKGNYYGLSLKKLVALQTGSSGISARKIFPLPMHFRSMITLGDEGLLLGGDSCILLFRNEKLSTLTKDRVHFISCMVLDSSNLLWTGGLDNDIVAYSMGDRSGQPGIQVAFRCKASAAGPEDNIKCMTVDRRHRIVYGMTQSGVYVMARDRGELKKLFWISAASGLSNNHVESLLWHDDTTLLAGTGYGLDKIIFPANKDSFYVQNISDFYNFSTTIYSIRKDDQGNILLGAESGLIKIPSVDIERRALRNLPIVISSIQLLSGKSLIAGAGNTIDLPYNNNGLNIFYSSPSFINERTTAYTYQLTGGSQNQWSQPSISNHVTLLNLSPGRYHFSVRSVNIYGQASTQFARLEIVIRPPVWQRRWFQLLMLVSAAALIFLAVRRRIGTIRRESAMKNKIAGSEMMALRAQMNPHFIFNCMNSIDGLITNNRKQEALDFLQKFSKLIRLVLENSQHQEVPLNQDLQALRLYIELEVVRSNYQFNYTFDIDRELQEQNYKIPPLLLQPYIENAIIHGLRNKDAGDGILSVRIRKAGDAIMITIEDNGIGRKKAMQLNKDNLKAHQPLGMKVTEKRLELIKISSRMDVSIEVIDSNVLDETGTKVTIILPVNLKM